MFFWHIFFLTGSPISRPEPTGVDNPAFTPDADGDDSTQPTHSEQALTTAEVHDTSEAPPDVLVDLEAIARAENQDPGEATVELVGYQPGETSTDVPVQEDEHEDGGIVLVVNTTLITH